MIIDDKIRDGKLQYDINREAAKISALSLGKIDKYEHLTGEEILPFNQRQIIEQAKFAYSPLEKDFEKQTKTMEEHGEKQVEALENSRKQFLDRSKINCSFVFKIYSIWRSYIQIKQNCRNGK